jgi:hypothetical protein
MLVVSAVCCHNVNMCSTGVVGDLVLEGRDDQTLLGLVTQILTALGTHPLDGDLADEVLAASVARLHEVETMAAAEKLRRIAEVDARQAWAGGGRTLDRRLVGPAVAANPRRRHGPRPKPRSAWRHCPRPRRRCRPV